ncbi:hypothetical protein GCM10009864_18690 [Streptomyces lunalinharesii]|uniref:Uncharacterized protein n=1 Tax=Streptomyces lunalinharesii TaxID=333384 RepID=A0ABN3RMI7_9ACTN
MRTHPSLSDPAAVALELEGIRRTIEAGFTRTDGALAPLVQRPGSGAETVPTLSRRMPSGTAPSAIQCRTRFGAQEGDPRGAGQSGLDDAFVEFANERVEVREFVGSTVVSWCIWGGRTGQVSPQVPKSRRPPRYVGAGHFCRWWQGI